MDFRNVGLVMIVGCAVAACGGGGGSGNGGGQPATHSIGVSVSGLWLSNTLVLSEQTSGQDLAVNADGNFVFANALAEETSYVVMVKTPPAPGQACVVDEGIGTVAKTDVTNIKVNCFTRGDYRDNSGTEYFLGVMPNTGGTYSLALTGDRATSGTVQIPALAFSQSFTVTPNEVTRVVLPAGAETAGDNHGVLVTANDAIVAVGIADNHSLTADAYVALAGDLLGNSYVVPSYTGLAGAPDWASEVLIVGTIDNTQVTLSTPVPSTAGAATTPITITVNHLGTYLLKAASGGDLSGTTLTADHPIAVFSGNVAAGVPSGTSYTDHLVEQLPPETAAGSVYHVVPLATRTGGDIVRVVGTADGTSLAYAPAMGGAATSVNRGQVVEIPLPSTTYLTINASAPVVVTQYAKGSTADMVENSDPFMMLVQAPDHYLSTYNFVTADTAASDFTSYLNLVVDPGDVAQCRLDGAPLPAMTLTAFGASGYSGGWIPIAAGAHRIMCPQTFGASVYGFAQSVGYGYPAGMYIP